MRLLESTDIVGIHNSNRYNTYNFTASEIMNYVTSRGYNSFILDPYYSNGGYWILMFNAVLDNGGLYLLDFNPNADTDRTGFYGNQGGYNRFICASSASSFEDVSVGITWTYESYLDRFYYTRTEYLSDMHNLPFAFYTTLNYTKLYVNGEDVTPVTYTWQSVPAISGKNGILSLTTLKEESINDGSPVDDATASAFNNAPNSCSVGGIVSVDLPIVDDNPLSIALKYNIPELTDSVYSSCKVVAKKNKIPKSKTDGDKILDVSPSSHGCVIKGLEQETKYYVVVFVEDSFGNKAESEPGGPVRTGKQSGIFKIRITTSQGVNDNDFKEVIEVTRV